MAGSFLIPKTKVLLMLGEVESEIFQKYKNALVAIGVDLTDESVTDLIEGCSQNLEPKFQAIISYWYWLQNQEREIGNANQLLIDAFTNHWTPIQWQDNFLDHPNFQSPAQKWWSMARRIDVLKNLIVDVKDNFWSGGKITFLNPAGDTWTMDLDCAHDMTWSQLLSHYQRVTNTVIESCSSGFTIHKQKQQQ